MSSQGFSVANLDRGGGKGPEGRGPRPMSRVSHMLAALLMLGAIAAQFVVALREISDPRLMVASLLVALPATAVIFRRPEIGVLLIVGMIPLQSLFSRHDDPLSLFKVCGGLTMAAFLIAWAFQGRYRLTPHRHHRLVLYVIGALLFAAIFTRHQELTFTALRRFATLAVFYFLLVNLVNSRRQLRTIIWLVMVSVTVGAGIAVVSRFLGQNLFAMDYMGQEQFRSMGTERDPNTFAATVLVGLPFLYYGMMYETRRALRLFCGGALILAILAIIYSFSRGGAIGLAVVAAVIAWGERRRLSRRVWLRIALVGALSGAALLPLVPREYAHRLASFKDWRQDDSLMRRGLYVVFGCEILLKHPFTGVGPGAFPYLMDTEYRLRFPKRLREERGELHRGRAAHNMYVEVASETGLPGSLAFGALLVATWRHLRRRRRELELDGPPELWRFTRSTEVGYLGFLITSMFLSSEYDKYLWLIFAIPVILDRVAPPAPRAAAPAPLSRGASPALRGGAP